MSDVGRRQAKADRRRRVDFAASLLIVLTAVGAAVWTKVGRRFAPRPSPAQCSAMVARIAEHSSRAHEPDVAAEKMAEHVRASTSLPAAVSAVASCERQLTSPEVECALEAPNIDALERCLQ